MNILQKLSVIQMNLLKESFSTKQGFHAEYISLPEMLPKVLKECAALNVSFYFTSNDTHLILKVADFESGELLSPAPHVRFPDLKADVKEEGKNITYMKRYLLMNTFMIIEDSVDPDSLAPDTSEKIINDKSEFSGSVNVPMLIVGAEKRLQQKGVEVTKANLRKQILNGKKWSNDERKEIIELFKKEDSK